MQDQKYKGNSWWIIHCRFIVDSKQWIGSRLVFLRDQGFLPMEYNFLFSPLLQLPQILFPFKLNNFPDRTPGKLGLSLEENMRKLHSTGRYS